MQVVIRFRIVGESRGKSSLDEASRETKSSVYGRDGLGISMKDSCSVREKGGE